MKILIVEDNKPDFVYIQTLIQEYKKDIFDITWCVRLNDAIEEVSKSKFDLILLDLGLPDSNGIETFLRMQENAENIPIAVLTGFQEEYFAIMAVRKGAIDYITKNNLNPDNLYRAIKYGLEFQNNVEANNKSKLAFQKYFDYAHDAACIIDIHTGIIHEINFTMFDLLGYKKKPNIGRHYSKIFPNIKLFDKDLFFENVKCNGFVYDSISFPKAKGGNLFVDVTASVVPWGMNKAILVVLRPAEKRLELEKCLIEINTQIENIIRNKLNNVDNKHILDTLKTRAYEKIQQAKDEIAKFSEAERENTKIRKQFIEEMKKINTNLDLNNFLPYEQQFTDITKRHLQNIFELIDAFSKSLEVINLIDSLELNRKHYLTKDRIELIRTLKSIEQTINNNPLNNKTVKLNCTILFEEIYFNILVLRTLLNNVIDLITKVAADERIDVKCLISNQELIFEFKGSFSGSVFEYKANNIINNSLISKSLSINTKLIEYLLQILNGKLLIKKLSNEQTLLTLSLPYDLN